MLIFLSESYKVPMMFWSRNSGTGCLGHEAFFFDHQGTKWSWLWVILVMRVVAQWVPSWVLPHFLDLPDLPSCTRT